MLETKVKTNWNNNTNSSHGLAEGTRIGQAGKTLLLSLFVEPK